MSGSIGIDPGIAIAAAGVAIAAVQIVMGRRRDRFENTFRIIQWLEDPEMLRIRNSTDDLISKAKELDFDFYQLSAMERAELSGVAKLFGLAGLLVRRNQVEKDVLLTGWSRNIVATYHRLEPYFEWRKTLAGGDSLRPYFEWLAKKAEAYVRSLSRRRLQ